MSEKNKATDLPWGTILAAIAGIGGIYFYLNPLQTSRPAERTGYSVPHEQEQDVDARLWQDPLRVVLEHEEKVRGLRKDWPEDYNREISRHTAQIRPANSKPYWVLGVMVPSGSYAEFTEIRLRMRVAVLEALGGESFVPRNGEQLGYSKYSGKEGVERFLPYEWCNRDHLSPHNGLPDQVLVLWLPEDDFYPTPFANLNWLIHTCLQVDPFNVPTRIIGPRTSTALQAMIREVKDVQHLDLLQGVQMWSAIASASDAVLLLEEKVAGYKSIEGLFSARLGAPRRENGFQFQRSALTDESVMDALIAELQLRGVKVGPKSTCHQDKVVLVSEWDTFFGRALPYTFQWRSVGGTSEDLQRAIVSPPENIPVFHYLRGIDGQVPTENRPGEDPNAKPSADKWKTKPREKPEGLNQSDYLRRLAKQLEKLDQKYLAKDGSRIRAVGVLGSDIYDKLLVLEALRPSLPEALFFTSGLDARLGHPDEWPWARNLIVAAPFGLRIRDQHRDRLPFFRDSNQTAVYFATLQAARNSNVIQKKLDKSRLSPIRIYEIGRNGPFDLTRPGKDSLQPVSLDLRHWLTPKRVLLQVLMSILIAAGIAWTLLAILGGRAIPFRHRLQLIRFFPKQPKRPVGKMRKFWQRISLRFQRDDSAGVKFFTSSWSMVVVLGVISFCGVYGMSRLPLLRFEPYSWIEGISIWPAETLRSFTLLLGGFFIVRTSLALVRARRDLERNFALTYPAKSRTLYAASNKAKVSNRKESPSLRARLVTWLTLRHWGFTKKKPVEANILWQRYREHGQFHRQVVRITPLILIFFLGGFVLMCVFGFPVTPARGTWVRLVDKCFLYPTVLMSLFVTFYVADVTQLSRRLVYYLHLSKTNWSENAFKRLRDRFKFLKEPLSDRHPPFTRSESSQTAPADDLLVDYLDIDFIARETEAVGELIYYPFIIISLMIISRLSLFDYWTWPGQLLLLLGSNAGYAAFSAFYLRRTAEKARKRALENLDDRLVAYTADGYADSAEAKTIRETAAMIRAENRGAFAAISDQPIARALLLPSGTAGLSLLLQYLPRL